MTMTMRCQGNRSAALHTATVPERLLVETFVCIAGGASMGTSGTARLIDANSGHVQTDNFLGELSTSGQHRPAKLYFFFFSHNKLPIVHAVNTIRVSTKTLARISVYHTTTVEPSCPYKSNPTCLPAGPPNRRTSPSLLSLNEYDSVDQGINLNVL